MAEIDYAELLDPAHLPNEQAVNSSLRIVEQHLTARNCIAVIEDILSISKPESIAVFLSGLSSTIPIERWILDNLTFNMDYHLGSTAMCLLSNLSTFFMFHLLTEDRELNLQLAKYCREVQAASSAIPTLASFCSRRSLGASDGAHHKKEYMKRDNSLGPAASLLSELGISMPTDIKEAKNALVQVIAHQRHLLSCYLDIIRMPEIRSKIVVVFTSELNTARVDSTSEISVLSSPQPNEDQTPTNLRPHEYRHTPHIITQSYKPVDGFGDWPILISGRTDNDLREWRRKDRKTFETILKKIRHLSKGDFSGDNQRRVSRSGNVVPIFEAKALFNCRLIYQVDCVPESVTQEKQAITIFGIYSPTELQTKLWDAVGKQLASRGEEYKNRCTRRVPMDLNSDRRHFIPAVFPPMTEKPNEEFPFTNLLQNKEDHELTEIYPVFTCPSKEYGIFADLDAVFPFQVSLEEKIIIEHPFSCYVLGRSGTGKTTAMLHKMLWIERNLQINTGGSMRARQIFVTKSGVLAEKVQEYFYKMLESLGMSNKTPEELKEIARTRKHEQCGDDLVDKDEDSDLHTTLPGKFSDLQDEHFPLFLTFDRLCTLLEADLVLGATDGDASHVYASQLARNGYGLRKENFVSYDRFLARHWDHYNQTFTKGLDPYSVFNELLGVLEGSELAALSRQKCLDANTYESLSERSNSTFSSKRGTIYAIFQSYRKMKREMSEYDAADRTHVLLHSIEAHGLPGRKFDYIYVDEAQDNLMIDALLLRILCRNPDGLFWAGDTAQTISSGCSFRFQDLKSMLYRMERRLEKTNPGLKLDPPRTFCLTVNYRSHTGIVNCAHSIVELIQRYWPYSIDSLAPEKGLIIGPPPVIIAERNSDDIQFEQFLFGSRGDSLEFGAHQCIIVHNDEAKKRLEDKVGDIGIILTIYESKGLEFNDVLLYNFFEDSTLGTAQWRHLQKQDSDNEDGARFDLTEHVGLCAELKSLYVAITRAKKNLWIADCSEKAKSMKEYWLKRNLVHVRAAGEDLPRLAETSTAKEWAQAGKMLFERKQYTQARSCFERAELPREMAIAHAYTLREHASRLPIGKPGSSAEATRRDAFVRAAEAFLSCSSKQSLVYFRRSGECFETAGRYLQASKAYYQGESYTESVLLYRRLGNFDEAIAIVFEKRDKVRQHVVDDIVDAAKLFYLSRAETDDTALRKGARLFNTEEEVLEYSDDMCLDGARTATLLSLGRYGEAVESFVAAGRFLDAIELLLKSRTPDSTRQACTYILQELWKLMPFGFRAKNAELDNITELLALSGKLEKSYLRPTERNEIEMFYGIYANDTPTLRKLGETFFEIHNFFASAHCFEQLYNGCLPPFEAMTLQKLSESLQVFQMYVQAMFTITIQTDPRNSPAVPLLFGLGVRESNQFFVPKGTFFYAPIEESRYPSKWMDEPEGFLINGETLGEVYRSALKAHLKNLLLQENESCLRSRAFDPCINFIVKGNCRNENCTRDHRQLSNCDGSWYNQRVHVYLVQISILQTLASLLSNKDLNRHRRIWISRLYEALHPPVYLLGSLAQLSTSRIPHYPRCLKRLKVWIQELVYDLSSLSPQLFITNLLSSIDLSLTFDRTESLNYICRAKFPENPDYLRGPHRQYAISSLRDEYNCRDSLTEGILFSKHVVDKCLPIDMGVLCNYLDFLCGKMVLCASTKRHGVLHEVLLPKSWWIKLMGQLECHANKSTRCSRLLFDAIASLLFQLVGPNKAEHLLHHSGPVKSESWPTTICWVYIARLCRAVCLLGHNLGCSEPKHIILSTFHKLSSFVDYVPPLCKRYFQSNYWSGIVIALHAGSYDLAREQLLLVCHRSKATFARDMCQERYYRRVYYADKHDLLAALTQSERNVQDREMGPQVRKNIVNDAVEKRHHQPEPASLDQESAEEVKGNIVNDGEIHDQPDPASLDQESTQENAQLHDIEEELQDHSDSSQNTTMQTVLLTEEEQKAGSTIRNAYRKYLRRKTSSMKSSARLTSDSFIKCLEQSQTVEWPGRSRYKYLYLGPLPNLQACLDCVWADIMDKKADAKKMLRNGLGPENIDRANATLTELAERTREARRLREALGPKGSIHQSRNQDRLKSTVQEAVTFIRTMFPNIAKGEMGWDIDAVEKVILKEKEKKATSRPELQVEDDMDYTYADLY